VRPVDELLPLDDPEDALPGSPALPVELAPVLGRGGREDSVPLDVEPLRV
jgi:hypothetical protein